MKQILAILALLSTLNAQNITSTKTSCIQQSTYPDKTLDQQKKILIEKAKQESLEELYGALIFSSTDIENGKLKKDEIKSRAIGAVRVKGDPSFYNGKNLGEICADVTSYITPEDLEKYSPKEVSLKHFCFNDTSVSMKDIKDQARLAAYKEMIIQYKPAMKSISKEQAENLLHGFKESESKFDFETASYCFDAVGTILPYELEMSDGKAGNKEKEQKLFNGIWEGHATQMGNGSSWNLKVTLKDQTYRIDYPSLNCGGDLILMQKDKTSMQFREKMQYGKGNCVDHGKVILTLVNSKDDSKLIYDWYYSNGKKDVNTIIIKQ